MTGGLPVVLEIADKPVMVAGGGDAGSRKIRALRSAGARVTVVDPAELAGAEWRGDRSVRHLRRPWSSDDAAGAFLVVAATDDPRVNEAVAADARKHRALLLRSDGDGHGDLRLPAVHRRGRVTVAVDTAGSSPTLAAHLRDRIAEQDDHWDHLAEWAAANRPVSAAAIAAHHEELGRPDSSATNALVTNETNEEATP